MCCVPSVTESLLKKSNKCTYELYTLFIDRTYKFQSPSYSLTDQHNRFYDLQIQTFNHFNMTTLRTVEFYNIL
jgi:hypothetical protein